MQLARKITTNTDLQVLVNTVDNTTKTPDQHLTSIQCRMPTAYTLTLLSTRTHSSHALPANFFHYLIPISTQQENNPTLPTLKPSFKFACTLLTQYLHLKKHPSRSMSNPAMNPTCLTMQSPYNHAKPACVQNTTFLQLRHHLFLTASRHNATKSSFQMMSIHYNMPSLQAMNLYTPNHSLHA